MSKAQNIKYEATVDTALRGGKFKVTLDNGHKIMAHLSGSIRRNYIKILPGDKVDVEMSPYDLTKGRITFRHRK